LTCLHCKERPGTCARRLCLRCYRKPGVRQRYPKQPTGFASEGDFNGAAPLPEPTEALPGTEAKLAVLCARAERKEALRHPDDGERE
jgi:hypothetical protein